MTKHNLREARFTCSNCHKDTFAVQRENGLEVKYRDRWILILNDAIGTVLFRCRLCGSVTAYHLGTATVAGVQTTREGRPHNQPGTSDLPVAPDRPGATRGGDRQEVGDDV
jgi:hypothetical protein